jgi:hypothetical protein
MTREEIKAQYTVDDSGVIRDLGKFEAEPMYAVYFWDSGMNGMADEDENGVWFFVLSPEDKAEFPELADDYGVAIEESDTGFVYCTVFGTEDGYRASVARMIEETPNEEMQ